MESIFLERRKHHLLKGFVVAALTTAVGLVASLMAQASEGSGSKKMPDTPDGRWGLGVIALGNQKPYKDIDREAMAFPIISYENHYVEIFGPFIDFKLSPLVLSDSQQLKFTLPVRYDFGGYDEDDVEQTPILNGMEERESGFWAGARIEWENAVVDVSAEWLVDISNNSDGQRFSFGLERTWMLGQRVLLTPRIVATWMDGNYVDYHYGVRANEARVDRPIYIADADTNIEYGIRGIYLMDRQNSLFIDVGATILAGEIKGSPLIDSSTENSLLIGYRYQF